MRFAGFMYFLLTGQPFSRRELADVRSEISFAEAIDAHLAWKKRLLEALDGRGEMPTGFGDDDSCVLGQWIYGPGQHRYGDLNSFAEIRDRHAVFHQLAGRVVELYRANQADAARRLLTGELEDVSSDIVGRLRHMSELFGR